jgi:uncharacterized membrane protein YiaA
MIVAAASGGRPARDNRGAVIIEETGIANVITAVAGIISVIIVMGGIANVTIAVAEMFPLNEMIPGQPVL